MPHPTSVKLCRLLALLSSLSALPLPMLLPSCFLLPVVSPVCGENLNQALHHLRESVTRSHHHHKHAVALELPAEPSMDQHVIDVQAEREGQTGNNMHTNPVGEYVVRETMRSTHRMG